MKITQCSDKFAWNQWYMTQRHMEFLQSWQWGQFRAQTGGPPVRFQFVEKSEPVDQAQGFVHALGFGIKYLYVPRWNPTEESADVLSEYGKGKSFSFIRIEPTSEILLKLKNMHRIHTRQPQDEWIVDVFQSAEAMLAAMHSKTRYNIRLAERKGVTIQTTKDIDVFWNLNVQTRDRDKFQSHGKSYYGALLSQDFMKQFTAMYQNKPVASILCARFGDTMTYIHGASSNEHRNVMAPYLLQWYAMKYAHDHRVRYYSLGGVAPKTKQGTTTAFHGYLWEPTHRFTGITRFKVGFGGVVRHYPEAVDIVLRPSRYRCYQLARKVKGYV